MKGPLAAALLVLWLATSARAAIPVAADFSRGLDYPLTKDKFGLFNSGLVKPEHYERDIPLYDQIKPNSLRVDLWWGGGPWSPQPVSGTPNNIHYHFEQMDRIAQLLNKHRVQPCWAYCYIPPPLQPRPGDWRSVGADPKVWGEVLGNFAKHARDRGGEYRIGYHEIYNEPDNRDFFRGTRDDYFALYREGSRAIRAADPDALIGGPALAFTPEWVTPFLEMVRTEALPLDFFSYHFYPKCWGTNTIRDVTAQMRGFLAQYPDRATTEMHLNEYNSFPIDYPRLGTQDRHTLAAALLEDYEWFLSRPDLAQICWAQFQDTGGGNWSGMIRRVYRIDSKHSSWGDDPETEGLEPVETREKISTTKLQWAGVLSKGGVLYLEVENARRQPANPGLRGARLVRELHYYPDRNSPGYAYLDKAECTARLGMASDAKSHQQVGILIENLPP